MNTFPPAVRAAVRRLVDHRSWRARLYLLLGLPVGLFWFVVVVSLYLSGIGAQFVLVGVLFLVGAQLSLRPIGRFERFLAGRLLGEHVQAPEPLQYRLSSGPGSHWTNLARRSAAAFKDGHSWRVVAWILLRFVAGPLGFAVVAVEVLLLPVLLAALVAVVTAPVTGLPVGNPLWLVLLLLALAPAGLSLLVPVQGAIAAVVELHRRAAGWALGPGRRELELAALTRAEAAEEQVRIDQELHDSIGHMLSMIVVQAGAGAHVFDTDPAFARSALRTIEERGRAALGELDRIIATLRGGSAGHQEPQAARSPLRGAEDLPSLLASATEAGMEVTSRLRFGVVPAAVGRGVYRIVQEALTNAAKHSPGSPVVVEVVADAAAVAISVVNPLPGERSGPDGDRSTRSWPAGGGTGRGLASIRDRAGLLGGEASTGATDGDAFAVRVVLPLGTALPGHAPARCSLVRGCGCLGCEIRRSVQG